MSDGCRWMVDLRNECNQELALGKGILIGYVQSNIRWTYVSISCLNIQIFLRRNERRPLHAQI